MNKDMPLGPGLRPREMRCNNTSCRVVTFIGTLVTPLNTCPLCQFNGITTEGTS